MLPNDNDARQFALMLMTGVPAVDAARYFVPEDAHPDAVTELAMRWSRCAAVKRATVVLNQGEWIELSPEQRIKLALEKHYNQMAYYLYTADYSDLEGARRTKADICRTSLEAKLAGMAGKMDALSRFYADMIEGKKAAKELMH